MIQTFRIYLLDLMIAKVKAYSEEEALNKYFQSRVIYEHQKPHYYAK